MTKLIVIPFMAFALMLTGCSQNMDQDSKSVEDKREQTEDVMISGSWQDRLIASSTDYLEKTGNEATSLKDSFGVGGRKIVVIPPYTVVESESDNSPYYSLYFNELDEDTERFAVTTIMSIYPEYSKSSTEETVRSLFNEANRILKEDTSIKREDILSNLDGISIFKIDHLFFEDGDQPYNFQLTMH